MDGYFFWAVAGLAAVLVGMAKGGLPMVGMLGVPVLALVIPPVPAAGVLLPVFIVSDWFGLWAYRREFDRRVLVIMVPAAVMGIGLGWATATVVPEAAVTVLVGVIGTVFAANAILRPTGQPQPRPARVAPGVFWGVITGFTSFVSHSGAPPYQVYTLPLGMKKAVYAGTSTILFAVVNAVKLIPYWYLGQFSPEHLRVAAVLIPLGAASVYLGVVLVRVLPERLFFRLVVWALLVVSIKLIWDGGHALIG